MAVWRRGPACAIGRGLVACSSAASAGVVVDGLTLAGGRHRIAIAHRTDSGLSVLSSSPTWTFRLSSAVFARSSSCRSPRSASSTATQVEAILAHELAHIRRHDYLVNLMQTVAETLLFYHPAVWWVSARIRDEREHCCDDLAVALCGDPVSYVAALTELETWRSGEAALAPAATGGSLLNRARQHSARGMLTIHERPPGRWALLGAAVVAGSLASIASRRHQNPLSFNPKFEVASVRPNTSGDGGIYACGCSPEVGSRHQRGA